MFLSLWKSYKQLVVRSFYFLQGFFWLSFVDFKLENLLVMLDRVIRWDKSKGIVKCGEYYRGGYGDFILLVVGLLGIV